VVQSAEDLNIKTPRTEPDVYLSHIDRCVAIITDPINVSLQTSKITRWVF
jgi:hypothetical protein